MLRGFKALVVVATLLVGPVLLLYKDWFGGLSFTLLFDYTAELDYESAPIEVGLAVVGALALIETIGALILASLCYERLPGKGPIAKGLVFGGLLILLGRWLGSQRLLHLRYGSPWWYWAAEYLEQWTIVLLFSLLVTFCVSRIRRSA